MLLIIRLHIPTGQFVRKRRVWSRATSLSMSELTATEALDPRKVTTGPEWWTVSLTRGEGCFWRSRWLVCVIQPVCNWPYFIAHLPG